MNIGNAFPSKYLKASDLMNKQINVTIDRVEMEDFGDDGDKAIVYFVGKEKGLVLNKTNANAIVDITGSDETSDWHGKSVSLYSAKVQFKDKMVPAIRVDAPVKSGTPSAPQPAEDDHGFDDDSVSF